ncbi:Glutathione S-transferase DHAR3, chloroplastic [Zea mays]|uniref:glutathione transferase n=2 Tax=Zea mays TaxID=4577 RepID=A0A3L6EBT4_MAIZE|nr:unknown [Zea mays]PWZ17411.1 Glutathione S-transferase DHAR3, chloroplastic [Zea mays]
MAVLLRSTSAAASTAGPSSALLATTFRRSRGCLLPRAAPQRRLYVARASAQPLEVCAKESITIPGRLGDCPFTQRVLLTIEEKHLPYDLKLVDLANKPDWLFEINPEGKVPIVKLEEKWIGDSDVITQALEEKYPEPPLATPPEKASVGSKIFSTFIGFLKSKDPSDGTEEALLNELTSFDSYLKDNVHWCRDPDQRGLHRAGPALRGRARRQRNDKDFATSRERSPCHPWRRIERGALAKPPFSPAGQRASGDSIILRRRLFPYPLSSR